jgi:hypothetical protein
VKFDRLGLTSWNVCKRMSERLEPIYRYWLRDHGRVIAEKVYHAFALEGSATH